MFAWLGWKVYETVDRLTVLGEGVENAGSSIQDGFQSAADAVDRVPVVGDDLANGLTSGGQSTGGNLAQLGQDGQDQVQRTAVALGLVMFVVPVGFVLLIYGPLRWRQVRRLTAATRIFVDPTDPERRRLLAIRAAFGLPVDFLLQFTPDPIGDLAAGRLDRLVDAVLADAGLLAPTSPAASALDRGR